MHFIKMTLRTPNLSLFSQLPSTSAGIKVWMYNLYFEKEKMLEEYHK